MISVLFDELLRRMNNFSVNLEGGEADAEVRNECYARSLAILHALQSCLDFEKGGEVAENLSGSEFARQQLLASFRSGTPERIAIAIQPYRKSGMPGRPWTKRRHGMTKSDFVAQLQSQRRTRQGDRGP